ncbi:prepilin-type N-terminal cleavage/methylation domain-containing protein [Pseudidiomarina mangrovi]|uniref:prepilin-type N-terminal cleavage/methylation domain-containing protein n=1 Tax=Pseudidiomarina mangrovi TaxID=2487133 RepID=UPI0013E00F75|nr:prepilin-type N-terminal cleavage/methylation domain-containing protein [Pseudidiomarina mangrovi]
MISKLTVPPQRQQRGFTFVELLVALVIIAVGVAGLVALQRTFIQSSSRAAERTAALEIAQQRLETLRFTPYADITGGSETLSRDGKDYSMTWTVAPFYYNGSWLTTGAAGLPDPLPALPDAKAATISISWTARGGDSDSLTMEAWLGRITLRDGGLVVTPPAPRSQPQVIYNPGAAPEVIAVRLTTDDNAQIYQIKETTRPTPTVQRSGDKLQVTFDTVTYDQATQTQRVEDFVTVNCNCVFTELGDGGYAPNRLTLIDGRLTLDPNGGQPERKRMGAPADANQPELCTQCCRDHHDNLNMFNNGTVYREEALSNRSVYGNHRHFKAAPTFFEGLLFGDFVQAGPNDVYLESCRMRRIDGYYAMYPDWQFKALTATSADYLIDETGAASYTDYVQAVVRALVMGEDLPSAPSDRDITATPGSYQMIGRGVYLDTMSAEHLQAIRDAINNGEQDWLAKVPFYEVNLTLLAEWMASNDAVADITNEPIQTIVDPDLDFYGTYSRGRVGAKTTGSSLMTVMASEGNASVLGTAPIHPNDTTTLSSTVNVTVQASTGTTTLYSVTGEINCLQITGAACRSTQFRDVAVTTNNLNISCSYSKQGNADTGSFACNGIPAGSNFDIFFSKAGFTFNPASIAVRNLQSNLDQNSVLMTEN